MNKLKMLTAATMLGLAATLGATESTKPAAADATATAPIAGAATEIQTTADPQFAALDTNGDGSLVQGDFPVGHDLDSDLFMSFDTDSDQRLSAAEYSIYAGKPITATDVEEEDAE